MNFKELKYPELSVAAVVVLAIGWASAIGYTMPTLPIMSQSASVAAPVAPEVKAKVAQPTCSLITDSSGLKAGDSTTITWTSVGGTGAVLNGAPVSFSGTQTVTPDKTTLYSLFVSNNAGAVECSTQIVVE